MNLSEEERTRYSRQLALNGFGETAQLKLKSVSILIVGAGGLGCPNLLYLAAAGVGRLGIIDGDKVSLSNLHRQIIFNIEDIGKNKSEIAKEALFKKNPNVAVKAYPYFMDAENCLPILKDYDLIIDASDNFETRYLLNDACVILNKPLVYAAIFGFEGQVSVFNYKNGPTLRCLFPQIPKEGLIDNCADNGIIGVLPGIIGTLQAQETIKIICGIGEVLNGKLLIFDLLNNELKSIAFKADERNKEIKNLDSYQFHNSNAIKEIDASALKQWLLNKKLQIIDVRETDEYAAKNIGGLNIPLSILPKNLSKIKDQKTVIICQSGKRSAIAYKILNDNFPKMEIYHLKDGLNSYF
ncbi:HesA/MoeB/ThiF family protein [Pedobacter sp. SD-b]|uniref:HesA/MoeB/ThiF family protein n=1 Tax=Pedobacter segetis TaxID=2793069 RepID=A0ABS1BNK3_9SPHI|nr:HesA/MoeB/ThiF family protein [Pedobacter segetis]MBK0384469.1 HesA/MoeB/ThiF family protein [Pedobacter segetis]